MRAVIEDVATLNIAARLYEYHRKAISRREAENS
jgi:hypothetical protein